MGGEVDGGVVLDKLPNHIQRNAGGLDIVKDDGKLVGLQGSVRVGNVAMEQVVQAFAFGHNDAVAEGMAMRKFWRLLR